MDFEWAATAAGASAGAKAKAVTVPSGTTGLILVLRHPGSYGSPYSAYAELSGTTATVHCNYMNNSGGTHSLGCSFTLVGVKKI